MSFSAVSKAQVFPKKSSKVSNHELRFTYLFIYLPKPADNENILAIKEVTFFERTDRTLQKWISNGRAIYKIQANLMVH